MSSLATRLSLSGAAAAALIAASAPAVAQEVPIGFLGGFTGPIESLTPPIEAGARLAIDQINAAGGSSFGPFALVSGDTGCADTALAASSADRLVNSESVVAIVGALCSGATLSAANSSGVPGGVVMVSPASTSPALTELEDSDLVFRTAPSDAYQGEVLARLLLARGIDTIAITYVNNDYGQGFASALETAYAAAGGTVAESAGHEDGRADYRPEIGVLEATGAETLVILAYADGSGQTILRQALESGVFTQFVGGDGMVGDTLIEAVGADAIADMIATQPGSPEIAGADAFAAAADAAGMDPNAIFSAQAYDAAFLLALAIEANGSTDRAGLADALRAVATAPGVTILPGQWEEARAALAAGEEINYEGASGSHEFDAAGDVAGLIVEMAVEGDSFVVVGPLE